MEGEEVMSTREDILNRLRQNTRETYDMPDLSLLRPITFDDPVAEFKKKTTTTAGAQLIEVDEGDDIEALIKERVAGGSATDTVGIIHGDIGVAENACIWIPQTMEDRSICFASEHLVIVLRSDRIVNNMHEAYALIEKSKEYFREYKFGTFISGPSKTADIEGALVYGAQAARAVTVVLVNRK
jgi:L-lactate dehydrogenase complex protein LldG